MSKKRRFPRLPGKRQSTLDLLIDNIQVHFCGLVADEFTARLWGKSIQPGQSLSPVTLEEFEQVVEEMHSEGILP